MTAFETTSWQAGAPRRSEVAQGRSWRASFARTLGAAMVAGGTLSGCINIAAPEAPIVIELNINIRQEVIYRLAADAANTIEENSDIF
jgi:hypothetical protein